MNWASWLHGLYLFASVFGIGVTVVDLLGLFGSDDTSSDTGDEAATSAGESGPTLSILRYLRLAVYFALGFGPVGLAAEWAGSSPLGSLLWALPGGGVATWLARAFFRFQNEDVDSRPPESDLLLEQAQVIVPLSSHTMGKVRVKMGQLVLERYALAEAEAESFNTDETVQIVRITDDCLYVRRTL